MCKCIYSQSPTENLADFGPQLTPTHFDNLNLNFSTLFGANHKVSVPIG